MKLLNEQIKIHSLCCAIVLPLFQVFLHRAVSIIMNDDFLIAIKKQPRRMDGRAGGRTNIYTTIQFKKSFRWKSNNRIGFELIKSLIFREYMKIELNFTGKLYLN